MVGTPWTSRGEGFTLLRREAGLDVARDFLRHATEAEHPRVLALPWREVAATIDRAKAGQLGRGFTFVDAAVVAAAQGLGTPFVLTLNARDFRPFGLQPVPS